MLVLLYIAIFHTFSILLCIYYILMLLYIAIFHTTAYVLHITYSIPYYFVYIPYYCYSCHCINTVQLNLNLTFTPDHTSVTGQIYQATHEFHVNA